MLRLLYVGSSCSIPSHSFHLAWLDFTSPGWELTFHGGELRLLGVLNPCAHLRSHTSCVFRMDLRTERGCKRTHQAIVMFTVISHTFTMTSHIFTVTSHIFTFSGIPLAYRQGLIQQRSRSNHRWGAAGRAVVCIFRWQPRGGERCGHLHLTFGGRRHQSPDSCFGQLVALIYQEP